MPTHSSRWVPQFLIIALCWGLSFLFIKVSLDTFTPIGIALVRCAFGALALGAVLLVTRQSLPRDRHTWLHLFIVSVILNSVPFTLFGIGETEVSSITAGIINAATPVATLLVLLISRVERPTTPRILGLSVGFVGVLVLLGVWNGISGSLGGVLACFGAICCYGIGVPYTRRFLTGSPEHPASATRYSSDSLAAGQLLCAVVTLIPVSLFTGVTHAPLTAATMASVAALGVFCTGVAYALNYRVIARAGASTASSVTYLTPIVSVIAGILILNEPLHWYEPVGGVIVVVGVMLSRLSRTSIARRRLAS